MRFWARSTMSAKSRLLLPLTMMAMERLTLCFKCRALELGVKPWASTTAMIRSLAVSLTSGWWFRTRETVPTA